MARATVPPFGAIIPNALLLETGDDEERADAERRAQAEIAAGLQEQLDAVMGEGPSGGGGYVATPDEVPHRISQSNGRARVALERALNEGADLGVNLAVRGMAGIGVSFNYGLVNQFARVWARDYSYELIRGIDATSAARAATAISRWTESGQSLADLREALAPAFGETRSKLIASTEVTRAYAEGTIRSYQAAGFADFLPEIPIPRHPACRCWFSLEILEDGTAYWIFNSVDEGECTLDPPCRHYNQMRVGLAKRGRNG